MKRLSIFISLVAVLALQSACAQQTTAKQEIKNITAKEVKQLLSEGKKPFLLDVRTEQEFNGPMGHIEGAVLIPVQELDKRVEELADQKDEEIIVYCRSGNRSRVASAMLMQKGFKVVNMVGGMKAWNKLQEK